MGAGTSAHVREEVAEEAAKPLDASDLGDDAAALRAEVVRVRGMLAAQTSGHALPGEHAAVADAEDDDDGPVLPEPPATPRSRRAADAAAAAKARALALPTVRLKSKYRCVWADEFSVGGLPSKNKWVWQISANAWNHASPTPELQEYTKARVENSSCANGVLSLTCRKEQFDQRGDGDRARNPDWVHEYARRRLFIGGVTMNAGPTGTRRRGSGPKAGAIFCTVASRSARGSRRAGAASGRRSGC